MSRLADFLAEKIDASTTCPDCGCNSDRWNPDCECLRGDCECSGTCEDDNPDWETDAFRHDPSPEGRRRAARMERDWHRDLARGNRSAVVVEGLALGAVALVRDQWREDRNAIRNLQGRTDVMSALDVLNNWIAQCHDDRITLASWWRRDPHASFTARVDAALAAQANPIKTLNDVPEPQVVEIARDTSAADDNPAWTAEELAAAPDLDVPPEPPVGTVLETTWQGDSYRIEHLPEGWVQQYKPGEDEWGRTHSATCISWPAAYNAWGLPSGAAPFTTVAPDSDVSDEWSSGWPDIPPAITPPPASAAPDHAGATVGDFRIDFGQEWCNCDWMAGEHRHDLVPGLNVGEFAPPPIPGPATPQPST